MSPLTPMTIPTEIRDRIVAAADSLFEQSGRQVLPTVIAVRAAARCDTGSASTVMREWRRAQIAPAVPIVAQIPDAVRQAGIEGLAVLWQQAQALANESLRSAQAEWLTERSELDALRQELAGSIDAQALELEDVKTALMAKTTNVAETNETLTRVRTDHATAVRRAEHAETRVAELERVSENLRADANRMHDEVKQLRLEATKNQERALEREEKFTEAFSTAQRKITDLNDQLSRAQRDMQMVHAELDIEKAKAVEAEEERKEQKKQTAIEFKRLAERLTATQAQREAAVSTAVKAELAQAELTGCLNAMRQQTEALLSAIKSKSPPSPPGRR